MWVVNALSTPSLLRSWLDHSDPLFSMYSVETRYATFATAPVPRHTGLALKLLVSAVCQICFKLFVVNTMRQTAFLLDRVYYLKAANVRYRSRNSTVRPPQPIHISLHVPTTCYCPCYCVRDKFCTQYHPFHRTSRVNRGSKLLITLHSLNFRCRRLLISTTKIAHQERVFQKSENYDDPQPSRHSSTDTTTGLHR